MSCFANNIKHLREQNNLSKSQLAEKLNVSQSTITRWENGEMGCTIDSLFDISNFFNISISNLLDENLKNISDFDILFDKNKSLLNDKDREMIMFIIEQRKKEIDEQKN